MQRTVPLALVVLLGSLAWGCTGTPTALPCGGTPGPLSPTDAWLEVKDCADFNLELFVTSAVDRLDITGSTITGSIFLLGQTNAASVHATVVITDTVFAPEAQLRTYLSVFYMKDVSLTVNNVKVEGPRSKSLFVFGDPNAKGVFLETSQLMFNGVRFTHEAFSHLVIGGHILGTSVSVRKWYGVNTTTTAADDLAVINIFPRIITRTSGIAPSIEIVGSVFNFREGRGTVAVVQRPYATPSDSLDLTVRCVDLPQGGTLFAAQRGTTGANSCTLQNVSVDGAASAVLASTVCSLSTSAVLPAASECDIAGPPADTMISPPSVHQRSAGSIIAAWFTGCGK